MEQPERISLVVGLGNPGEQYANTRHNAGYATIDVLAERFGARYWKSQAGCMAAVVKHGGSELVLAKPQSFMNTSGGPVAQLCSAYGVSADELLVIHDELDIPAGDVRVKLGGGAGGHNGIKSIMDKLGSPDFTRVRLGIGRPPGRMDPADFVLRQLKGSDADDFAIAAQLAADAVEACISDGVIVARDKFNGLHREQG